MSDFRKRKLYSFTSSRDALKLSKKCVESPMILHSRGAWSIQFHLTELALNKWRWAVIRYPQTRKLINKLEITAYNVWVQFYRYLFGNLDFSSFSALIISATLTLFVAVSRDRLSQSSKSRSCIDGGTVCLCGWKPLVDERGEQKSIWGASCERQKKTSTMRHTVRKKNVTACDLYKSK